MSGLFAAVLSVAVAGTSWAISKTGDEGGGTNNPPTVTDIRAINVNGQTFITWNNLPGSGWRYRVYRALMPINSENDLANAVEMGSVTDSSSVDRRISSLLGSTETYRIPDGTNTFLSPDRGLFVVSPDQTGVSWYAVTGESRATNTNIIALGGDAITGAIWESYAPPQPIYQRHIDHPACEDFVLFAPPKDTPGSPAMWPTDNHAYHFGVIPGQPGGGLVVHGHGRGGSFFNSIAGTGTPGETVIAPDDNMANADAATFYQGYASTYDPSVILNTPATSGAVIDYTDRFVTYLLDWAMNAYHPDRNRVYAMGSSMGGSFAYFYAWHHSDRIAAAIAMIPKLCMNFQQGTSSSLNASFARLWSAPDVNLPTVHGVPIYDWLDARAVMLHAYPLGAAPVIGFCGRNDEIVGWPEKIGFFASLEQNRAGGAWYWDGRTHNDGVSTVTWQPIQADWAQLYHYRLDRSYPALSRCSADQNPGTGSISSGDTLGSINGAVTWDDAIVDTRESWEVVLRARDLPTRTGTLVTAASVTVDVTPRRLQQFLLTSRTNYNWIATDIASGLPVGSGTLGVDAQNVLTIPSVNVLKTGTRLRITPLTNLAVGGTNRDPRVPALALSANPIRGRAVLDVTWPASGPARVALYDVEGRRTRELLSGVAQGRSTLTLSALDLAPGVYVLDARQGSARATQRVVVVR